MNFRVSKRVLIYMIGIQSFFSNYIVTYIKVAYYTNLAVKLLFLMWILVLFMQKAANKGKRVDPYLLLVFSFNVVLLLATIYNHGNIQRYIGYFAVSAFFTLMPCLTSGENGIDRIYLDALAYVFRVNLYINLLAMIVLPKGLTEGEHRINLLGYDNLVVPVVITGLVVLMYRAKLFQTSKFWTIIDFAVCSTTMILLWSGTGIIGFAVLLIMILLINMFNKVYWLECGMIITAVAFVFIVVMNAVSLLAGLVDFLGKDLTFTGRTYIWSATIDVISKQSILGQGIHDNQALVYNFYTRDYRQAHNEFLQIILNCGYIGLVLFLIQFYYAGKRAEKAIMRNCNLANGYLIAGLITFLVLSLAETYGQYFMTSIILGLCYYYNEG